jgi:hypothetical protein
VRVLLDGNLPRQLGPRLAEPTGYVVHTIHQRRWSGLSDGALLDAAAGAYDAFVTLDRNLVHQQNLAERPFAILVLRARTNRMADLEPLVPALLEALGTMHPGEVRMVGA